MSVYMVERSLPGVTMDQLGQAQKAAIETAGKMTASGKPVKYIRSAFVPGDQRCYCFFEADNADTVRSLNEQAGIPFKQVVEALDLSP